MPWNRWYSLKSYLRSALWTVPIVALLLQLLVTRATHRLDAWIEWPPILDYTVSGAVTTLQIVASMNLTFIVFAFGSLLVAIQVASGQMTPRIIATTLLRDNAIRFTAGLFIFTFTFAASALARMETTVHHLVMGVAWVLAFGSLVAFLFLIDYAARLLRPVSILGRVGEGGLAVIESVYPKLIEAPLVQTAPPRQLGSPERIVHHRGTSAIVLAVNVDALFAEAQRSNGIVEFAPHVGDFVSVGEPLFRLYGGAGALDDRKLRSAVAFGPERTIEQDATFAFRVIVDIANKALSKAINDPTTAVLAIDQLHRLLRMVGKRHLRAEEILDRTGQLRVIFRTPNWEDFVHLAFSEIRQYGAENFQIARRLRAMSENLVQTLPEHCHGALRQELDLLDRALVRLYELPEDLALARIPDSQGLGGSTGP